MLLYVCFAAFFALSILGASASVTKMQLYLSIIKPHQNMRSHFQQLDRLMRSPVKVVHNFESEPVRQAILKQEYQRNWRGHLKSASFDYAKFDAKRMSNLGHLWIPAITKSETFYIPMMHTDMLGNYSEFRMFVKAAELSKFLGRILRLKASLVQRRDVARSIRSNHHLSMQDSYRLHPLPIASLMIETRPAYERHEYRAGEAMKDVALPVPDPHGIFSTVYSKEKPTSYYLFVFFALKYILNTRKGREIATGIKLVFPKGKLLAVKAPFQHTSIESSFVQLGEVLDDRPFMLMSDYSGRDDFVPSTVKAYAQPGDMLIGILPSGTYPMSTPIALLLRNYEENSLLELPMAQAMVFDTQIPARVLESDEYYKAFVTHAALQDRSFLPSLIDHIDAQRLPDPQL